MRLALVAFVVLLLLPIQALGKDPASTKRLKKADRKLQAEIDHAIRKGTIWLLSQQERDGSFPHPYIPGYMDAGGTALSLLALLHCDVKPKDRRVRRGFDFLRKHHARHKADPPGRMSGLKVYVTSVMILALAQYGTEREKGDEGPGRGTVRLEESDLRWAKEMTDWLVSVQAPNGGWGYPDPGRTDASNSQYALLALKEARRLRIRVPRQVFEKALDWWLRSQEKDGPKVQRHEETGGDGVFTAERTVAPAWDRARGWGYIGSGTPTGSMTTAGVAAMALLRTELGNSRHSLAAEQAMYDGLAWLGHHFSVEENSGIAARHHFYYLYGLERAGVLAGVVWMGDHRWYAEGARYLVDAQERNGGWDTTEHSARGVVDPCFALLFLARSTRYSFAAVSPQGPVELAGGDELPDKDLGDLFDAAFSEMLGFGEGLRQTRARDFTLLGPRVIGLLLPKLSAPEGIVRDRAILILRSITGKEMGYDPTAPEPERKEAAARWSQWHARNRSSLSRDPGSGLLSEEPPPPIPNGPGTQKGSPEVPAPPRDSRPEASPEPGPSAGREPSAEAPAPQPEPDPAAKRPDSPEEAAALSLLRRAEVYGEEDPEDHVGLRDRYLDVVDKAARGTSARAEAASRAETLDRALPAAYRILRLGRPQDLAPGQVRLLAHQLANDLESNHALVRLRASEYLARLRTGEAARELVTALSREEDPETLEAIKAALSATPDTRVPMQLAALRWGESETVQRAALEILDTLARSTGEVAEESSKTIGTFVFARNRAVADEALRILVGLGRVGAWGLMNAVTVPDHDRKLLVIKALGDTGEGRAAGYLAPFMTFGVKGDLHLYKVAAAEAIQKIGYAAIPYLARFLDGPRHRHWTKYVLYKITGRNFEYKEALLAWWSQQDRD